MIYWRINNENPDNKQELTAVQLANQLNTNTDSQNPIKKQELNGQKSNQPQSKTTVNAVGVERLLGEKKDPIPINNAKNIPDLYQTKANPFSPNAINKNLLINEEGVAIQYADRHNSKQLLSKDLFNINNISSEHVKNFYSNVLDKTSVYVMYNDNKFTFRDYNKTYLGYFSVIELIRYVIGKDDKNNYFINKIYGIQTLNPKIYRDAKKLIKNFLLIRTNNSTYGVECSNIKLHNSKKSPFMADLQMIIHLNNDILEFEKAFNLVYQDYQNQNKYYKQTMYRRKYQEDLQPITTFSSDVDKLSKLDVKKIKLLINELIYLMLVYTIKLITIVSLKIGKTIVNNDNYSKITRIKQSLHLYSLQIMTKLSYYTKETFMIVKNEQEKLEGLLRENNRLKHKIYDKIGKHSLNNEDEDYENSYNDNYRSDNQQQQAQQPLQQQYQSPPKYYQQQVQYNNQYPEYPQPIQNQQPQPQQPQLYEQQPQQFYEQQPQQLNEQQLQPQPLNEQQLQPQQLYALPYQQQIYQ